MYAGGDRAERGVGIMMTKRLSRAMKGFWAISDRVILMSFKGKPIDLNVIQVYAPTAEADEDILEEFYDQINRAKKQCKPHEFTVVMGDLNAKVGRGRVENIVGPFGLGERNERGDRFVEWCAENKQMIANTWFRHHPRRLWTWKSPGDQYRNQIDYITVSTRFRNAVTQVRTYPGADCSSDHVPVVMNVFIKLKKLEKRRKTPRLSLNILKENEELSNDYRNKVRDRYSEQERSHDELNVEDKWDILAKAMVSTAEEMIGERERVARGEWMTEDILMLMDRRRACKGVNEDRYLELDLQIRRACNTAKEEWMDRQCEEIEDLRRRNPQKMYDRIKTMRGKKWKIGSSIMKTDGTVAMEIEEVLDRWKEYIGELFEDEREAQRIVVAPAEGPAMMKDEIEKALKRMKVGKAAGEDGILVEMVRALGEWGVEYITHMASCMYDTGERAKQMERSLFVTIPKKAGTLECSKHRTIAISSQISKVILRVVMERLKGRIRQEVGEEQFGFLEGKGTTNAIFVLRMLAERAIEMQKDIYVCFIDYEKAFDRVKHGELIQMLESIGADGKDIRMIENVYWNQKAAVKIDGEQSEWVEIKRGVRQGCVMSPDLFSLYGEFIMREAEDEGGLKVGGRSVNNIRYADDTVLIADSEEKLLSLLQRVHIASEEKGLSINVAKTECMVMTKGKERVRCELNLNGERIKQVDQFCYLGSWITADVRCEREIKYRIEEAKRAFNEMRTLFKNRNLSLESRKRMVKTYVWSILLYGCETWTISRSMEKRLEAAEMWMWRRVLNVSWTQRVRNERVLERMGTERELMTTIRKRQLQFLGHVLRLEGLEHLSLTGRIEGVRARGRQREKYMDGIRRVTGGVKTAPELIQMARERKVWKSMIANVS